MKPEEPFTAEQHPHTARYERAQITLVCDIRPGSRAWRVARLEDLSQGGFRIADLPDARAGMPLRIRMPGIEVLNARVCWVRDNVAGCEFEHPLYIAVFEHMVRQACTSE